MENTNNIPTNPFKLLEGDEKVPENLKDKVMSSINFSNMLLDITELFTTNMASSVGSLFKVDSIGEKEEKNKDDKENKK
ncbi:MAG: hypothetical protein JNM78_00525 [Cyclobacteriaceae bacterium]|nr:hypothetical protein [Cyclobacteriaceae bacterium]